MRTGKGPLVNKKLLNIKSIIEIIPLFYICMLKNIQWNIKDEIKDRYGLQKLFEL